ncbi:MAG: alpha/beta fold hydrolase [Candidatus Omnitrophota bacterium]
MKKLIITLVITAIFAVVLIVLAFLYIDFAGHKTFPYDVFVGDELLGSVKVDRYATEDKVIYKARADYLNSVGCPLITEKLLSKKGKMLPLKYTREISGARGASQTILIEQNEDKTDFLFLSPPRFFSMKDFETGHKTLIFSPYNIMTYMPVMERYNFWKKGTQFFEVMIPIDEPVPIFRDKIEVEYSGEEYISIMGRKAETELFTFRAKGLPEAKVFLSKYKHQILSLEVPKKNLRFVMVSEKGLLEKLPLKMRPAPAEGKKGEDVFFESGNQMLSGQLWMPKGDGSFPAAIIVSEDGPMTNAERSFQRSYAEHLSDVGFAVLMYDKPGQGKSQGNLADLDDERRILNIQAAVSYLKNISGIRAERIILIGYKGGGYLCLKAAEKVPDLHSCVVLSMTLESLKTSGFFTSAQSMINEALRRNDYGSFEEEYMVRVTKKLEDYLKETAGSTENFSIFMGMKVPLKGYREYITRVPYEAVLTFDKPLFMIFGRQDMNFDAQSAEDLKKTLREARKDDIHMAVIGNLNSHMGMSSERTELLDFKVNEDVPQLIENWARKERQPVQPPEEPVQPSEEKEGENTNK